MFIWSETKAETIWTLKKINHKNRLLSYHSDWCCHYSLQVKANDDKENDPPKPKEKQNQTTLNSHLRRTDFIKELESLGRLRDLKILSEEFQQQKKITMDLLNKCV